MIRYLLQPVVFDGVIYVLIGLFGYLNTTLGTDEAAKFITPAALFWARLVIGGLAASTLAIKLYRSTTFAEYRQAKNGSYHNPPEDLGNKVLSTSSTTTETNTTTTKTQTPQDDKH